MMTGIPLLETKLYLPQWSADRVSRPRLIDRIHPKRKLTLVSAPAGFGKTTLLAEWVAAVPDRRVAWVSLDQSDNDPAVFWNYVITALQKIEPDLGVRSLSLLQSPQPPPIESVLMILLNELTAVEADIVLILDDYHEIETPAIHRGIGFLLSHLPPQMHLIIASRADPPLSLARLRSHGELTELRVSNLRFTPDEAAAFLNQGMGLAISAADVSALEQRTEGWIAGLQLAALSLQGREDIADFVTAFSGNDRYIVDYLLEEVLQRQSEHVRRFLLQTAILERLSGALCDAVTDQADGQAMLETLERGNLFIIPLDNKRQWYRYHHLFADVLLAHAHTEWPKRLPTLHGQASQWYEQHELFSEAIRHAIAAEDFVRAAELIEQIWPAMRNLQQEATVLSWLKALPDPLIRTRPILSVAYALVLLHTGPLDAVEVRLQDAERQLARLAAPGQPSSREAQAEEQYRSLPAAIANARAFCAQVLGDFAGAITHAQQALALLPSENNNERGVTAAFLGLAYWTSGDVAAAYQSFNEGLKIFQKLGSIQIAISATLGLANIGLAQGLLQTTIKTCEQVLKLAVQQPGPILRGMADVHLALSEIRYEQGDLAAASQLLKEGEALREQWAASGAAYLWWLVKAQLTAAKGDLDTALEQLHEAARLYHRSPIPNVRPIEALKVRWWLQQGRLTEALGWVRESGLSVDDQPEYLREYEHLTLARVLIAQHRRNSEERIRQVIEFLTQLLAAAEAKKRTGSMINILVVLALANEAQRDIAAAIAPLERALTLAEPEGYVRIFTECGTPMAHLLQEAITRSITPTYTTRLLAALETWGQPQDSASSVAPAPQPLIEPLSQRELDVLRLLSTELSGPEIARELVVALSTVRTHTKRIYSKLDVTNRRAAVKRAAELGLI
ncbi:helix-turn-helix transcriptional regulator [Leptolyngbya cf. ectocarpi LEGE 11479]|uniref:Helix-turn-helix transcriptional regulator n=1 Tax=Leptolyngbya cf. ectocarpi LEGE 11479 TaxID=1828722 RepID=A0A928ZUE1_LEPEC|nr:LuxR C-terminal-related transcriptional regulator [Leptolyngbya ectocarpi]MBE9067645.1 helix-turn-helix transcriptional regulator [Leptolyngbya cf. ectocarpi LEGE 11479]